MTQAGYHKVFCSVAVRGGVNVLTFPEGHWMGAETRQVHEDRIVYPVILLMVEIRRSPVEERVVYPIIYTV